MGNRPKLVFWAGASPKVSTIISTTSLFFLLFLISGAFFSGHGVNDDQNWSTQFFRWWNETFPHPDNSFTNGAVPAVTSEYYSACFKEHIGTPPRSIVLSVIDSDVRLVDEDVDLIILELGINDGRADYFAKSTDLSSVLLLVY